MTLKKQDEQRYERDNEKRNGYRMFRASNDVCKGNGTLKLKYSSTKEMEPSDWAGAQCST